MNDVTTKNQDSDENRSNNDFSTERYFPVLPLKNGVLFPGVMMPLSVGRGRSVAAVNEASNREDKSLVVVNQRSGEIEDPELNDLNQVGTLAVIRRMQHTDQGLQLVVQGQVRVKLLSADSGPSDFLQARIEAFPLPDDEGAELEALHRTILERAEQIVSLIEPQAASGIRQILSQLDDPLQQVFLMATMMPLDSEKEQRLLAVETRLEAMRMMNEFIAHEAQVMELRHKITSQAQSEMTREQREYLLRQQMRAIQQELGESDSDQAALGELKTRLEGADLPDSIRPEIQRELNRLERIPVASPEHQLTRSYVEMAIELPWKKKSPDNLDLKHARQVLDDDHYDLEDIKDRIIEHLAVLKLNPDAGSPILCFVGPPGVGKTSLGQSIARALGREFERMSLGGMHDEAELRGHRRTYIGAMPGRLIQAVRRAGVRNPLIMLDEIDKVGREYRGDPTSALLEILDPAQNFEFRDNYLDLPFDLSDVFFVTTANTLDTIPEPLLDRMEVIRLSGYTDREKQHIARKYLIPRRMKNAGLKEDQFQMPDETLVRVIQRYTREAGVRELERVLGALCRKVAMQVATGVAKIGAIDPQQLKTMLGSEKFFQEDARTDLQPGVAAGLAYTTVGGAVLYVEAILLPGSNELKMTGKLGDVMRESAVAAQSFVKSHAERLGIKASKLKQGVHIHIPAGAVPKDGPSAGVTIATALTSLLTGHAVDSGTAMTGEITLSGLVLPVGGIKEKVLGAHRARMKRVILPKQNEQDLGDVPEEVRNDIEFLFAERIEDVLTAAIPDLDIERLQMAS